MRHRSRPFLAALSLLCATPLLAAATDGTDASGQSVRVEVTGLRSAKGVVRACMTPHKERFPQCRNDGTTFSLVVPAGQAGELVFANVPPGQYAIALLHDENNNGKADRAMMMIPREGFGFSRDAKVVMGPPSFGEAMFDVGHAPVKQAIHMRYML
ncbi:MAG: hypothetical protein RLZZ08_495 [Pseudomonadota bacterium]